MRMSNAALERQNPELASAVRKIQQFGTPTTPEAAQRALARLTSGRAPRVHGGRGRAGRPAGGAEPRRPAQDEAMQQPAGAAPGAGGRKKRKR